MVSNKRKGPRDVHVLIVDDHPSFHEMLRCLIQDQPGLELAGCASNGVEAIQLAKLYQPDVILMDYSMPGMNGAEATRRILAEYPKIRVVAYSSYDHSSVRDEMRSAGASHFLLKGDSIAKIIQTLFEAAGPLTPSLSDTITAPASVRKKARPITPHRIYISSLAKTASTPIPCVNL